LYPAICMPTFSSMVRDYALLGLADHSPTQNLSVEANLAGKSIQRQLKAAIADARTIR